MTILWSSTPPPPRRHQLAILKPGQGLLAVILGHYEAVEIHWVAKRSRPCTGADCPMCRDQVARQWRAYLPCQVQRFERRGSVAGEPIGDWSPKIEESVVELTESHAEFLEVGGLRGLKVEIWKPAGDVRQPLHVTTVGMAEGELPPPFAVRPVLYRLWGISPPKENGGLRIAE